MLAIYIQFFKQKEENKRSSLNMNYIIGLITAMISVITLIKIINSM